eukprot:12422350-Karenia_brevis.AAC.1
MIEFAGVFLAAFWALYNSRRPSYWKLVTIIFKTHSLMQTQGGLADMYMSSSSIVSVIMAMVPYTAPASGMGIMGGVGAMPGAMGGMGDMMGGMGAMPGQPGGMPGGMGGMGGMPGMGGYPGGMAGPGAMDMSAMAGGMGGIGMDMMGGGLMGGTETQVA